MTAINDIDFQEKLDQREKQGPEMEEAPKTLNNNSDTELHATDKQGARTSEEDTGEQLGALGDLRKPTRSEDKTRTNNPSVIEEPVEPNTKKTEAKAKELQAKRDAAYEKKLTETDAAARELQAATFGLQLRNKELAAAENRVRDAATLPKRISARRDVVSILAQIAELKDKIAVLKQSFPGPVENRHKPFVKEPETPNVHPRLVRGGLAILKAGTPIGEDRVTKNSFVGAKSNADSDFAAMLSADRALNDPKHVVDTFNRIVKATVGDIVKVITEVADSSFSLAAEFDFDKAGKPFIRAIAGMFDSALTPEVAAHHEAAHVVVQIVQQTEGKAAAKRMVDLANQDYIRKQVSEKMGITASYFLNSPEELFVQAYALWATGALKLNSEPVLTKVFRAIKSFFAGMTQDEGLASAFHAIRNGEFANSGVELNHASLENRLHKSKHDFFSYGGGKPSRADVNKVLKALNLTSKDVDMQKIYDDKEAFFVLVALSTMAEADITNEEAAEIKGILTEYGIAPKSKGAGAISDKLIDAVADVVLKENYARITTPEKALAFARAAKQVLGHLQAITPEQWGAIDAKDEDHYDKLQSLKNQLEGNFDQSGHASFDWQSLFDGEGTKADEAEMDRIVKNSFVGAKYFPESHKSAEKFFASEPTQAEIDKVFTDHGWFKGPDGKLRREVAPGPIISAFNKALDAWNKDVTGNIFTGEALLSLPKLLADAGGKWAEAYGEAMKGYTVSVSDFDSRGREIYSEGLGSFDSRSKIISVSPTAIAFNLLYKKDGALVDKLIESGLSGRALAKQALLDGVFTEAEIKAAITSTFMHEFQHAIQNIEGFDGGSNSHAAVINAYATVGEKMQYKAALEVIDEAHAKGQYADEKAISVLADIEKHAMQRLMEKLGPDGDYEAEAHRLYLRSIGETEAREVQHRIKLLGPDNMEGRRALKPGLSYTASFSLFSTNFLNDVAASIVRNNKQDARTELGNTTAKDQQEALDEIPRIRGKDVRVAFGTLLGIGGSGEFSMNKDKTKRLIRLAIDGANMKSTAWHESLHDFIAMLGGTPEERKLKRDMFNATNTPYINAKLRELLKNHPAALKQLSDPEERLAYVYQFWAEGALQLKGNADTLMQKIADFIQKLLGIVSQDGKLDAQLAALHRGELTEPSTVARVLDDLDAKTVRDKLDSLAGPLADGLSRVLTSATDRLRKPGVEALGKLADLFHKDPGHEGGKGGMLQRRAQKEGQLSNAFQNLVDGTTAAERLNALSNLQAMKTPQGKLELGLTKLLDEMYGYMNKAGVATFNKNTKKWDPVRRVANYFPRSWDGATISKDVPAFKALLAANGVSVQQQDAIVALLTKSGGDQFDLAENEHSLGFVPLAVHVNDRMLTFINQNNAPAFAKYQKKDLTDIMTTYIRQASHRAEYTRSFGNNGEVIEDLLKEAREQGMTHAEEEAVLPTIRGLEGTLGHDMNPELKKLMSGVITMENVLLMPMAIFSQLVDPIGIAMRTNSIKDAGEAYLQSLKDLKKAITRDKSYDYDRELTKMLGIISTDSMLETMGQTQGSMYMSSAVRNINKQFFRYNGMEGWNNSMRVAATVAGERYLIANVANERAMAELDLDPKNIKVMPKGTNWGEAGRMAITKEQFEHLGMTKPEAQAAAEQIQEAMFRFVDGAVVRPNAAHRATWMSDPRFQLLSHLKQFTFSFQAAVLNRARNEYIHGNSTPMLLLSMTVPIMLASDIAKWAVTGTMPANWTALDYMAHAVVRSGILGKYEYAARSVEDAARGNVPGLSFAGPTVEHANILAQWIAGAPGASSDRVVNRSIPLARYA